MVRPIRLFYTPLRIQQVYEMRKGLKNTTNIYCIFTLYFILINIYFII